MTLSSLRPGLVAWAAIGGLATTASAQLPAAPATTPSPQVIRWPGGYMVMNGPEVIVRSTTPAGSTNLITGSGNGIGNRIVVSGGTGGVTIVQGVRNGIGNQLILDPNDWLIDLDALLPGLKPACPKPVPPVDPAPAVPLTDPAAVPPSYKGKDNPFWTKKVFNDSYDCNLYWCPKTKRWFRYTAEDDTYRPVPNQPAAPDEG